MEWSIQVELTHDPMTVDAHYDAVEALETWHAVGSLARDGRSSGYALTIDAPTLPEAITRAEQVVADTVPGAIIVGLDAKTMAALEAEMSAPQWPDVVGYAEIAEMAGVSRQRAHQFTRMAGFPPAVITTAQGPLMRKTAVAAWLGRRDARPGRRPVTV